MKLLWVILAGLAFANEDAGLIPTSDVFDRPGTATPTDTSFTVNPDTGDFEVDASSRRPPPLQPGDVDSDDESEAGDRARALPFEDKVPLYCFNYSIRSRMKAKSYVSSCNGARPVLGQAPANTATAAYTRWVHKHVNQAADCFGADASILFALWSGESAFQVSIKNAGGGTDTGFSQFMVGGPAMKDTILAVMRYESGRGMAIEPELLRWMPEKNRQKMRTNPACRAYLQLAQWGADRMNRNRNNGYCSQARDLVNTEPGNLERSVQLNAVLGTINHLRALAYAKKDLEALAVYLRKNVPIVADREKLMAAAKIQAGWGQGGSINAAKAMMASGVRSLEEFDRRLGSKDFAKKFDLYVRAKEQTFRGRLYRENQEVGKRGESLQKCAPFVKSPR